MDKQYFEIFRQSLPKSTGLERRSVGVRRSGLAVSPPLCTRWPSAWATCLRMFYVEYGANHLFGELWKVFTNLCGCIKYLWVLLSKLGFLLSGCEVCSSHNCKKCKNKQTKRQNKKTSKMNKHENIRHRLGTCASLERWRQSAALRVGG